MIKLQPGYNALTWRADTVPISSVPWLGIIVRVHTLNPISGEGYVTFEPGNPLSNMRVFAKNYDYLVKVTDSLAIAEAEAAPADAFADFPGYVPPVISNAPTMPPGRTETGTAAEPIIGGRLVAQTLEGLRHYSSAQESHLHLLFGVALNSALKGGSVSVRRPGYVHFAGWELPVGTSLMAGDEGRLVTSIPGSSFYHLIGRSLDAETLIYQPGVPVLNTIPQTIS